MKKLILIVVVLLAFSCKKEVKNTSEKTAASKQEIQAIEEGVKELTGDFLYYADAAVFKTPTQVYGVVIDKKMHELADKVAPLKKEDTDMVKVVIKGKIVPKSTDEEGWPYNVIIKEIVEVKQVATEDDVVIKNK